MKRLRWAFLLIGVAVLCLVAFTGYQALKARDALTATSADFQQMRDELTGGDTASARETLTSAQASALLARDNTRGPGWWLAAKLPGIGDDVAGVQTVADVADNLASDVLPGVIDASQTLSPERLRPKNGRIDIDAIARVAPAVVSADREIQDATSRIAALEPEDMIGQVASPVTELQGKLTDAADLTAKASRAVQLLPSMLGADGRRTYLVLFQNNAEIRATGGLPGALAVMSADHGKIKMHAQGGAADLGSYDKPALPLTREERALFDTKMGIFPADSNFTPDFPRTAELVQAMWQRAQGQSVDGVLSADPIALSYLLRGTGPVRLGDGAKLTADGAVQLLLNTVYLEQPDTELQDVFFASAARNVFDAVSSGRGDPRKVLEGLAQAASERRLLMWSDDRDEQALLQPTPLAGALFTGESDHPQIGVYLNDGTGAKLHYYVKHSVDVESLSCEGGVQKLKVTVTMSSDAPADARTLPASVVGGGFGVKLGTVRTGVLVYGPGGGRVESATLNGRKISIALMTHEGRPVANQTVDLAPGGRLKLEFLVVGDAGQTQKPALSVTPGVRSTGVGTVTASACS